MRGFFSSFGHTFRSCCVFTSVPWVVVMCTSHVYSDSPHFRVRSYYFSAISGHLYNVISNPFKSPYFGSFLSHVKNMDCCYRVGSSLQFASHELFRVESKLPKR